LMHGKESFLSGLLNKMVRGTSGFFFGRYLKRFTVERGIYIYDEPAGADN